MKEFINRRIWDKEKGLSYFCSICGMYKPEKDFYNRKNSHWGKEPRCKIHFTKRDKDDDRNDSHLKLQRVTKEDFIGARKVLEKLGYDTSGEISVHEQFKKRHNLK